MNILCRHALIFSLVWSAVSMAVTAAHAQAPANDDFANRQTVPAGLDVAFSGSTVGATQETFEKVNGGNSPAGDSINETKTVWYDWVPSVSGTAQVADFQSTSEGQTYLLVFKGNTPDLAHLFAQGYLPGDSDDPAPPSFPVTAGQEYVFSLGNTDFPGAFTAKLTLQPAAPVVVPVATITAVMTKLTRGANKSGKFLVSLSSAPTADLIVNYKVSGSATVGSDYKMLPGRITVPAGSLTATVKVRLIDDSDIKATLGIKLKLTAADGYTVGSPAVAKIKIIEAE